MGSRSWSFFTLHIMTRCSNSNLVDQGWIELFYIEVLHIFLVQINPVPNTCVVSRWWKCRGWMIYHLN